VKGVYYGWWLVAIALATNMVVYGTTHQAFQVFVLPASKDYGLSRAEMNTAMVLFSFGSAAISPFVGRLIDFISPRATMFAGVALLAASFATLGLTHSLWLSAVIFALPLAAAVQCCAQLTLPLLINRWFLVQRGRAMALGVMGMSVGFVVVVPAVGLSIARFGWRPTLLIMAAAVSAILLVLTLLVRDRPRPDEREPGAAAVRGPGPAAAEAGTPLSMGAILRMPQFWTITAANTLSGAIAGTLAISLVPIAVSRGFTPVEAAALVPVMGVAAIGCKLTLAVIADRVSRIDLMVATFLLSAVGNAAMLVGGGDATLFVFAATIGVASGGISPLLFALLADRFGAASFGTVAGLLAPFSLGLGALAARFAGEVFDRTGGYGLMHLTFVAAALLAAVIMFGTRFTRKVEAAPAPVQQPA
jgi:MFS family permease